MIKKVAGIATIVVVILVIAIGITKANPVKVGGDKFDSHFVASKVCDDFSAPQFVKGFEKSSFHAKLVNKQESKNSSRDSKEMLAFTVKNSSKDVKESDFEFSGVKFSDADVFNFNAGVKSSVF